MAKLLFELTQVSYAYLGKFPALSAVDLSVEQGSKVAIIGANGSGKSTLLAMLDALLFPDRGTVKAWGEELNERLFNDVSYAQSFRRKVGFVFQNPDIQLFCPTVKEDIMFGPLQLGVAFEVMQERFKSLVGVLHLESLLERSGHQLSIGEKRKVALASVLIADPDVLLLDEPTAGLDPQTTRSILDLLLAKHEEGKTIITSTHDMHIVEEIADIMHVFCADKSINRSGPPQEILSDTQFLQACNLIHIHPHRHLDKAHTHPHAHLGHHPE
ncbi:MAG: ABC transporter ATP-binding protein [Candidatus Omnitrophica bacterium]|nr:ABC transporter ATP-binding protein [Candidatus Omnitrophota bacterium]